MLENIEDIIKLTEKQCSYIYDEYDELDFVYYNDKNGNLIYGISKQNLFEHKECFEDLLYSAVEIENKEIVEFLIQNGTDINIKDDDGKTPLYWAIENKSKEMVKLLIKNKADLNIEDKNGETPLYCAFDIENEEIIKLLIENTIDLNIIDEDKKTPLHWAVENKNKEIVELLIQKKVNLNIKDKNGRTPLYYAIKTGNKEIVQLLLKNEVDLNIEDKNKETPLYYALKKGKKEIIDLLTQKKLNIEEEINKKDKNNKTPLSYAFENLNMDMTEFLIHNGANNVEKLINEKIFDHFYGNTLLHNIAFNITDMKINEYIKWVKFLIKNGADVNVMNYIGETPLHYAVKSMDEIMVKLLIKNGADINAKNKDGETPLQYAIETENKEMIELLIQNGANVNIKDKDNKKASYYCKTNKDLTKFIKDQAELFIISNEALKNAIKNMNEKEIQKLVKNGVNLDARDKNGKMIIDVVKTKNIDKTVQILNNCKVSIQERYFEFNKVEELMKGLLLDSDSNEYEEIIKDLENQIKSLNFAIKSLCEKKYKHMKR